MADLDTMLEECEQIYIETDEECTDCTSRKLGEIASTICQANKILDDKFRHDKLELKIVMELPDDPELNTIYLLAKEGEKPDIYDEYVYVNGEWEIIGNTQVDLTDYVSKEELETILADYLKSDDFCTMLETCEAIINLQENKQDKLIAGDNITIDENNVISATGGSELPTKAQILSILGYREIPISMTDDEDNTDSWTILAEDANATPTPIGELTKAQILSILNYEESQISMLDENSETHTWNVLTKIEA